MKSDLDEDELTRERFRMFVAGIKDNHDLAILEDVLDERLGRGDYAQLPIKKRMGRAQK